MAESVGQRVYLVRLALGDGVRDAMPMRQFADLLHIVSGETYSASTISDIETGKRRVTLEDVATIAATDPLHRGREWLAWGTVSGALSASLPALTGTLTGTVGDPARTPPPAQRETHSAAEPHPPKQQQAANKAARRTQRRKKGDA